MWDFLVLFFKVQCFPYFHDKTRLGVVSLCWSEITDQNMIININLLAATVRSFKMLIDYTLDLTSPPPLLPLPPIPPSKERRRRNCFKIPTSTGIVVAHVVMSLQHPKQILSSALGNRLPLFQLFKLIFVFISSPPPPLSSPPPPPLPPMHLLKSSHQSWVWAVLHHEWGELASDWLNCTGKPITCYDTEVGRFDDVKGNWCCDCGSAKQKLPQWLKI